MSLWARYVLPTLVEKACRSHAILAERKRWVPRASGAVLEVGVGSGLNIPFFDAARATSVVGLDISPELLARARVRAAAATVRVDLVEGDAERMPFDRARFDTVVLTYTLCSVPTPARTLAEIHRVLRPGGELIFVEHGRSPDPRAQRLQRWITPAWRRVGGNCHLDRDIAGELTNAGFPCDEMHAADNADHPSWLSYKFQGIARRP
ncbi:MAG TPA: class I SAM-dependent methyltransferase [Kofleriaceae bacterium]